MSRMRLSVGSTHAGGTTAAESKNRRASSAPPSPSRHDPWRFLPCMWICVIAVAL